MKKMIKSITTMSLIAGFMLMMSISANAQKPAGKPWAAPDNAVSKANPAKGADAVKEGKEIYMQHCKSCHGAKGKGDGPKADKIDISCNDFSKAEFKKVTDGELYWKTTEGRKPMPAFKDKLSDGERWSVVAFLKTLTN